MGHGVTGNLNFLHQIHAHPYSNSIGAIGLKLTQHAKSTTPNVRGSRSQSKENFSPLFSQPDSPIVVRHHSRCSSAALMESFSVPSGGEKSTQCLLRSSSSLKPRNEQKAGFTKRGWPSRFSTAIPMELALKILRKS